MQELRRGAKAALFHAAPARAAPRLDAHHFAHLRPVARRGSAPRWRLVGLLMAAPPGELRPALQDWAAQQGLQD